MQRRTGVASPLVHSTPCPSLVYLSVHSIRISASILLFSPAVSISSSTLFSLSPFFPVTKLAVSLSICWFFLQRPSTCSHLLSCWPPLLSSPFSPLLLHLPPFLPLSECDAARPIPGSVSLSVIQSICRRVNFVYSGRTKPLFFFNERKNLPTATKVIGEPILHDKQNNKNLT